VALVLGEVQRLEDDPRRPGQLVAGGPAEQVVERLLEKGTIGLSDN
jgi:hypothetical protein